MNNWSSLSELIWEYNQQLQNLAVTMVKDFEDMFEREPPSVLSGSYQFTDISSQASFDKVWAGRGFYMILSDYVPSWERQNACTLTIDGLPVIYRGQADKVRERLRGHLDNRRFLQMKKDKAQSAWERCLKLDEIKENKGGIDFDVAPFNCARWAIVVLPMSKSTSQMRELVEWAFDRVFKRPVASNERKQIPHAVKTALDDEQARWRKMKIETAAAFEKFDNE